MTTALDIKGVRDGLLIQVPEGEWTELGPALLRTIDDRADFFRGARLALQLEERDLGAAELGDLRNELLKREVNLWAILSSSDQTQRAAADLGLALTLTSAQSAPEVEDEPLDSTVLGDEAVLLKKTLRSGQVVRHPGHVIVLGDVNPGAEIIAGGHIIVWGRLRGTVHAGAAGDDQALVCALDLSPTQLRIAGHIAISPSAGGRRKPEVVKVNDGQLMAEDWQTDREH
jgi:septum site-determining protein MinC